jgi:hypothetical protein
MYREGCIYIVDPVPGAADLLHRRKQDFFVIKAANYEFFYSTRHSSSFIAPTIKKARAY